ncbi:hypothetical protein DFR71_6238 [Nocardia alba]|uniref:Uncharacterized protein n=1 Tax=Nocardia alba TaxID=225051 RepID=A0A4R1FDP8_9NOCA|nr:hypothetical protein DFR71_6238 [Nocardia alba]
MPAAAMAVGSEGDLSASHTTKLAPYSTVFSVNLFISLNFGTSLTAV